MEQTFETLELKVELKRSLGFALRSLERPIVAKLAGEAKSYAERLFAYPVVGALTREGAERAIGDPFGRVGIRIEKNALDALYERTRGYPYFLQSWGSQLWNFIEQEPITLGDVNKVESFVLYALDMSFFRIRMERLTPSEREFVLAMATVSKENPTCGVGEIAKALQVPQSAIAPRRAALIRKGMIYSPSYGMLAFTVPLFADYVLRTSK